MNPQATTLASLLAGPSMPCISHCAFTAWQGSQWALHRALEDERVSLMCLQGWLS